jgi:predicted transposase YbfD/YdcC
LLFSHYRSAPSSQDGNTETDKTGNASISGLLEMLAAILDPRDPRGRQYALSFVLAVCIVATLAGAKNYAEISRRARDIPQPLLKKLGAKWNWFKCRYQWPSLSVIRNVLTRIDASELDAITGAWLFRQARKNGQSEWELALDGKVVRGAWTEENDKVTLFSAMTHREAVTIAQVSVPGDTNEITQADALLEAMEIPAEDQVLVTVDAAHTQHETARSIRKNGFDYLMRVKGNQPTLQREVFNKVLPLLQGEPHDVVHEHTRGCIKKWSCWITDADGIEFPDVAQAGIIRRDVFEVSGLRVSKDEALMITSRSSGEMTAAALNFHARKHWGIENKSHYVRDTVYREDQCQAWYGEGPHALASLRNFATGLLRLKGVAAIKETTEWIAADRMRALRFLTT